MKIQNLSIEGLKLITLDKYGDDRGYFVERYHRDKFLELGLNAHFVQDNLSSSAPGVIRGLHYQTNQWQGKLVGVISGAILDVAVDLRRDSATFGQHLAVELSEENNQLLWIPVGFAHGFGVLGSKNAHVVYKVDAVYNAESDTGIIWNDPDLGIDWRIPDPLVSPKDCKLPTFRELQAKHR